MTSSHRIAGVLLTISLTGLYGRPLPARLPWAGLSFDRVIAFKSRSGTNGLEPFWTPFGSHRPHWRLLVAIGSLWWVILRFKIK